MLLGKSGADERGDEQERSEEEEKEEEEEVVQLCIFPFFA